MKHFKAIGLCVLAAAGLTACGGSDDDDSPTTAAPLAEQVGTAAAAGPVTFTTFVSAQAAAGSETAEPFSIDAVATAPTSETTEPSTVN